MHEIILIKEGVSVNSEEKWRTKFIRRCLRAIWHYDDPRCRKSKNALVLCRGTFITRTEGKGAILSFFCCSGRGQCILPEALPKYTIVYIIFFHNIRVWKCQENTQLCIYSYLFDILDDWRVGHGDSSLGRDKHMKPFGIQDIQYNKKTLLMFI